MFAVNRPEIFAVRSPLFFVLLCPLDVILMMDEDFLKVFSMHVALTAFLSPFLCLVLYFCSCYPDLLYLPVSYSLYDVAG